MQEGAEALMVRDRAAALLFCATSPQKTATGSQLRVRMTDTGRARVQGFLVGDDDAAASLEGAAAEAAVEAGSASAVRRPPPP